jgi:hypothetical protein
VNYEKNRFNSILDPSKTLIIRGSQDHALVGPLENQALTKVYFVGAFSFRSNLETIYLIDTYKGTVYRSACEWLLTLVPNDHT